MEELQDALEDAQYVNAINIDEGPRPIIPWEHPSDEALSEWKRSLLRDWENDPNKAIKAKPFEFDWVISKALGLFLFSSYVKDECGDHVRMCFIEEVLRWRCLRGRSRGLKLRKIYERYLMNRRAVNLPNKTLIDEVDMAYSPHGKKMDASILNDLVNDNIDDSCEKCCIGIDGPLRDEILGPIEQALLNFAKDGDSNHSSAVTERLSFMPDFSSVKESSVVIEETKDGDSVLINGSPTNELSEGIQKKIGSRSIALSRIPDDLFDKIEQVILECLRRKYWSRFAQKGVSNWDKLLNFLWHESQPVLEEDFFLMRVLGRGGFGLVTGTALSHSKYKSNCMYYF